MRRLLWVTVLAAVAVGAFLYVNETSPPWYERIRYPLRYSEYVRVHAREHDIDPALLAGHVEPAGARVGAIVSGGNVGLARFLDLLRR